jgi:SAM-dependent methyltransferase
MTDRKVSSTALFTDRADHYARHRPSYPAAVLDILGRLVPPPADAADIAAGTGILSRDLAAAGYRTVAVEPNAAMSGEIMTGAPAGLSVAHGTGERTGLADGSVDLITVAQAFHWLDPDEALTEFRRIGRPGCLAAIVWNTRQFDATPFMRDYRAMLVEYAPEYGRMKTSWANLHERATAFFPGWKVRTELGNTRRWDLGTLLGNLWSLSYAPPEGSAGREALAAAAEELFERHSTGGHVEFVLSTIAVAGPVEQG